PEVKRALHVGDIKFSWVNLTVNTELAPDFLSSSKPLFEELLEHYRVLAYCGQLDQMLPCAFSSELYRTWHWNESGQFLAALRLPFMYNNKLAGYYKSGGGLTWAVIRGAGHMVPLDRPAAAQRLVTQWTHRWALTTSRSMLDPGRLMELITNSTVSMVANSTVLANSTEPSVYL
ncbi:putative retinoid-inducible serine carboxypeptidase, partial [Operophtera brumata]